MKATTDSGSVRRIVSTRMPTRWGVFQAIGFERCTPGRRSAETAIALVLGDVTNGTPLVRVHSQCLTGEVLGSLRCDCHEQLEIAMRAIAREGRGLVIYEHQEGRGIGLMAKLRAYELQDVGLDTVDANQALGFRTDYRDFGLAAAILQDLGIRRVRLMTNNPDKSRALVAAGIGVVRVPCESVPSSHSLSYLRTKRERLGHELSLKVRTPSRGAKESRGSGGAGRRRAADRAAVRGRSRVATGAGELQLPRSKSQRGRANGAPALVAASAALRLVPPGLVSKAGMPGTQRLWRRDTLGAGTTFARIEAAIVELRAGRMVVVVDDEDRENEGDLTIAAEAITPEAINFMATHGRGLICLAMTGERLDELDFAPMVADNTALGGTAFTVSIDARVRGVTTGISAHDRANTILAAIDADSTASDFGRPGHVFPLRARPGGVLERRGQTEAAVDLARLAGMYPAGVICEIVKDDGTMARVPDLVGFCEKHGLLMVTVADLVRYRLEPGTAISETLVTERQ